VSKSPREGNSSPQPQRPPDTNYTYFTVLKLSLFMVHKLKAVGLEEILKGFEPKGYLEDLDPNHRYFIFKTSWCVEAEGKRFTVYCGPIREDLEQLLRREEEEESLGLESYYES
jgi:hypothetical protein